MNTGRIVEVIDWAVGQGVRPFAFAYPVDPSSFEAQMMAHNVVEVEESISQAVVAVLKGEPELRVFDGGWIRMKSGGGSRLKLGELTCWLLAQTLLYGSDAAVQRLQEFVGGQHRGVREVLALIGVTVEEETELADGVSLVPFSSLPRSQISTSLLPDPLEYTRNPFAALGLPAPTAALVSIDEDGVELVEGPPDPTDNSAYVSRQPLFHQISQCLTLVGPSSPVPTTQWAELVSPERVPFLGMQSGWGASMHEAYPQTTTALPGDGDVVRLVEQYLALDEDVRKKLTVPLQRLNLALRRQDVVDKAIELGIALEALLVADRDENAPISYLLRIQSAEMGAASSPEEIETLADEMMEAILAERSPNFQTYLAERGYTCDGRAEEILAMTPEERMQMPSDEKIELSQERQRMEAEERSKMRQE